MNKITLLFFAFLLSTFFCWSQDGAPDLTFGNNGRVETNISGTDSTGDELAYSVAQDNTGKLIVVGKVSVNSIFSPVLVKYNSDGTLDSSFGTNGVVYFDYGNSNDAYFKVFTQNDNKIICGGNVGTNSDRDFTLTRFLSDGTLDTSFGAGGHLIPFLNQDTFSDWAFLGDGSFYIYGSIENNGIYNFAVKRYLADGALDTSFGSNGMVSFAIGNESSTSIDVKVTNNNNIVLTGKVIQDGQTNNILIRLLANGSMDTSFGNNGVASIAIGQEYRCRPALYNNNDIALMCTYYNQNDEQLDTELVRYTSNGNIDTSFGNNGYVNTNTTYANMIGYEIIIQENQRLIIFGEITNFLEGGGSTYLSRYTIDGAEDNSFNFSPNNFSAYYASEMILQDDGKIVCVGTSAWYNGSEDFVLERYNNNPLSVEEFGLDNIKIHPNPSNDFINVSSPNFLDAVPYQLIDLSGKIIKKGVLNSANTLVDLSQLQSGIYILKASNSNFRIIKY